MKNQAQGTISMYLVKNTDMDDEEFQRKLHIRNIVGAKLTITSSDGEVHNIDFADVLNIQWDTFDSLEEEEDERGHQAVNSMTKIN
ncbi:hypothetical protein V7128_01720 [Neobacillus vireti]|uniref:hypothetical protein n=1 Tax=Neobacillus vireti TaxID=220686 RepID=UPI002FFD8944